MRRSFAVVSLIMCCCVIGAVSLTAQPTKYGDWWFSVRQDAMTDASRNTIYSMELRSGEEFVKQEVHLAVRCHDPAPIQVLIIGEFYFPTDPPIQYRFDSNPPSEVEVWKTATRTAFAPDDETYGFLEQALAASRLRIRVTDPIDGLIFDYKFSLDGFKAAFQQLKCRQ